MGDGLVFLLLVFAVYRITRLLTLDTLLDRPRAAWWRRFPPEPPKPHPLGYIFTCPFCAGAYVTGAVVVIGHIVNLIQWPWRFDLLIFWAVAGGAALLNVLEERIER